jgi:ribosomal protein L35
MSFRKKFKVEGGQGGKRGHSGMTHWAPTEEIKNLARKLRRRNAVTEIEAQLDDDNRP